MSNDNITPSETRDVRCPLSSVNQYPAVTGFASQMLWVEPMHQRTGSTSFPLFGNVVGRLEWSTWNKLFFFFFNVKWKISLAKTIQLSVSGKRSSFRMEKHNLKLYQLDSLIWICLETLVTHFDFNDHVYWGFKEENLSRLFILKYLEPIKDHEYVFILRCVLCIQNKNIK